VAVPLFRLAVASADDPLFNWTWPVAPAPDVEETLTEKLADPQDDIGLAVGTRLTITGSLTVVTIRLSDTVVVA
jgi:hypothetical protein